MEFGLERAYYELQSKGQTGKKTFVVFESRGKKEDADLELEFRRLIRTVELVDYAGDRVVFGFRGLVQGAL